MIRRILKPNRSMAPILVILSIGIFVSAAVWQLRPLIFPSFDILEFFGLNLDGGLAARLRFEGWLLLFFTIAIIAVTTHAALSRREAQRAGDGASDMTPVVVVLSVGIVLGVVVWLILPFIFPSFDIIEFFELNREGRQASRVRLRGFEALLFTTVALAIAIEAVRSRRQAQRVDDGASGDDLANSIETRMPDARYHDAAFAAVQCAIGHPVTRDPALDAIAIEAWRADARGDERRLHAMTLDRRAIDVTFLVVTLNASPSSDPCVFGGQNLRAFRTLWKDSLSVGIAVFPSLSDSDLADTLVVVRRR